LRGVIAPNVPSQISGKPTNSVAVGHQISPSGLFNKGTTAHMTRRKISPINVNFEVCGETAHFAHAAAKVMAGLTAHQLRRSGEDLIELLEREAPMVHPSSMKNRECPSTSEAKAIARRLESLPLKATELDHLLVWLGELLGLEQSDITILAVFARWGRRENWRELVRRGPFSCSNLTPRVVARLTGLPNSVVEQRLMHGSPLFVSRLLNDDRDGEYSLSSLLKRLISFNAATQDDMLRMLLPEPEHGALRWQDFEHLDPLRDIALQILASRQPVSILLFGEPGTGKTEFARTLAAEAGTGATFAGLTDDYGNEPDRSERLDHLMVLRAMCRHRRDRVIVVDEADDVLKISERRPSSKQWIHRLVESPEVPTLWIVNDRSQLSPAVLRRMTLAIGFDRPHFAVRERIVKRSAENLSLALTPTDLRDIASIKAPPAVVAAGLNAAKLTGGGAEVAKTAIHSVLRSLGQSCSPEICTRSTYNPQLSNADTDLTRLAQQLAASPDRAWSLLLSGPSGTGKSAYARYLADLIGIEIEERRASDLMSPYVGETEQNIAEAFATAAERGALLLIDEAESFLYRREAGQRSWEVRQVNEMLVQLEHLRSPFVATTNLADNLDAATQRRFTVRATFKAMTLTQMKALFESTFGLRWPKELPLHEGQTPGDFAVVAHRARLLGERDPLVLVKWLLEEIEARGETARGPVGFQLPSHAPSSRLEKTEQKAA
jgi:AAA+ superfamily predicted ATPase